MALLLNCQKLLKFFTRGIYDWTAENNRIAGTSGKDAEVEVLWKASACLLQHQGLDQLQSGFHVP